MRAHDAVAELLLHFERQAFLGSVVRPRASARRRSSASASRGNSTSTTAPMHWTMVPCCVVPWSLPRCVSSIRCADSTRLDRGRAADDLRQFLGDRRLARLVVDQLSSSMTLPALSEAAFIATMRADCSEAMFSATAWKMSASM